MLDTPTSCNSYMIVDKVTHTAVYEFYSQALVERVNTERYYVLTAYDYLVRFNARINIAAT